MKKQWKIVSVSILFFVLILLGLKVYSYLYERNDLAVSKQENNEEDLPADDKSSKYTKISGEEAKKIMEESDDFILLDVRTEKEFMENRIYGAILIPDFEMDARAATELPDKDKVILIYCRSGRRSADTAKKLSGMGYNHIYDFGGINDWPYETVND